MLTYAQHDKFEKNRNAKTTFLLSPFTFRLNSGLVRSLLLPQRQSARQGAGVPAGRMAAGFRTEAKTAIAIFSLPPKIQLRFFFYADQFVQQGK